jgi:GntR family transcriptional regulator
MRTHTDRNYPQCDYVEDALVERISSGILVPGTRLPTEDSLIAEFGVDRNAIRATIQSLVQRGLVENRGKGGRFITRPKITQELTELTSFVEDMQSVGRSATATVIDHRIVAATEAVAQKLSLPVGTIVIRVQRVRLADQMPLSFDETYLPRELGEKVIKQDLETEPIFSILETKCGVPLVGAEYRLESALSDADVAEALQIRERQPVFLIERTSYSEGNRPVDYEKLHYRGDQIQFVTWLARRGGTVMHNVRGPARPYRKPAEKSAR